MSAPDVRAADWVALGEALERVLAAASPLDAEEAPLLEAAGRVLAEDIGSGVDHPPWDNSAMDGFAVRADDVRGATRTAPVRLELVDEIAAGELPRVVVGPGEAAKIMTGAPVPEGADSVVRIEHTDAWESDLWQRGVRERVGILSDQDAGRNIRRRGEDLRMGDRVLARGDLLRPAEIGVLASVGRTSALVHRRPVVGILSNGDELVEPDRIAEVAAGRAIVNSNAYALAAATLEAGGVPRLLGIARDEKADIRARVLAGADADVLVTSAGAAVGEHDLVKRVLGELGLRLEFWRVRVRPGSPLSFGRLPREGRPPLWVFGLAGNPVSAVATFLLLVRPFLLRLQGRRGALPPAIRVRAAHAIRSKPDKVHLLRARLERDPSGRRLARLTGPQGSGILTSLTRADALLVVPEGRTGLEEGEEALAIPLRPAEDWAIAVDFAPADRSEKGSA